MSDQMPKTDPRSLDFVWTDLALSDSLRRVTNNQIEQFNRDGYFIIEDLISPESLTAVLSVADEYCDSIDSLLKSVPDERLFIAERGAITFAPHAAAQFAPIREFVSSRSVTDLVFDMLGPDARLYHDQFVYKGHEKPRRFPWHQDNGYAFVSPESYLTIWIALSDATVESGCVWVAPGMHRNGTMLHTYIEPLGWQCFDDPPLDPAAAPIKAGDAVVFSSITPHLTGPNLSNEIRKAYIIQFVGLGATRFGNDDPAEGLSLDDDEKFPLILKGGVPT